MSGKKPMNVVFLRRAKLSQEKIDRIQDLLLQGYTQKEVGKMIGKSQGSIEYAIRTYNLKTLSKAERSARYRPKKLDRAIEMLKEGKSQVEVASELGLTQGAISQWIKRYNIEVTPHEYKRGVSSTETESDIALIKQYLSEKKNLKEIGNLIGVSGQTIDRWIKKYDLDDSHIRRWRR